MTRTLMIVAQLGLLLLVATTCSGDSAGKGDGSVGGNGSSGTLAGTWDVTGPRDRSVTFSWTENKVTLVDDGTEIEVTLSGDEGQAVRNDYDLKIERARLQRAPGSSFSLGQIPFNFSGRWTLTGEETGRSCVVDFKPDSVTASGCNSFFVRDIGVVTGHFSAKRTAKAESLFGELGGRWEFYTRRYRCDVTLIGGSVDIRCHIPDVEDREYQLHFTVNEQTGFLSGTVYTNTVDWVGRRR